MPNSTMFSIVILSRNPNNLIPCVLRILEKEPGLQPERIIVVDDGAREVAEQYLPGVTWVPGIKPFCFARNANLGLKAAGRDDVILCNDDALLETEYGFATLWAAGQSLANFGVISAATNHTGNDNQWPRGDTQIRFEPRMVCFICALLKREVIDRIGGLDESLVGYGLDDDDYCLRARNAGFYIGVWDGCVMDHGSLTSTFRGDPSTPADYRPNLEIFKKKWGMDNWGNPVRKAA